MPTKKKKIVKLQNKTNMGLFELDDSIKRDDNKIRSVHRISEADEARLYEQIGYKPSQPKKRSTDRPSISTDIINEEQPNTVPVIASPDAVINTNRPKVKDLLHNAGIS